MTILQVIESLNAGGAERHVIDLRRAIADRGIDCLVVAQAGALMCEDEDGLINVRPKFRILGWYLPLWRSVSRDRTTVIHVHSLAPLLAAWLVARLRRRRLVFTVHGWSPSRIRVGRILLSVFRPDLVIAVSVELAQRMQTRRLITRYVPNGVLDRRGPIQVVRPDGGDLLLISVGRLSYPKNQASLIRAYAAASVDAPPSRLVILGEGEDRENLMSLAERLTVGSRVEFLGFRDPIPYLEKADVFVSSSLSEGLSLAHLEAMMIGLPLIVTSTSGANEIVEEGRNGTVVPTDDEPALTAAIRLFLEDSRRWDGRRSRALYEQKFKHETMVDSLLDLYGGTGEE